MTWTLRSDPGERRALDRHCDTVGPVVLRAQPDHAVAHRAPGTLAIVSWNVHVGGGDIAGLVDRLESGALTGTSVGHYVLLLEEAYRAEGGIPAVVARGVSVPGRIAPRTEGRHRQDIVALARHLKLALYYVPSMRNGAGPPFEDRGNAILSTLPLDDVSAIELPFTRQRRVAIGATIQDQEASSVPWRLRLFTVHLDALAGPRRLWILASGWRGHQARTVVGAIDHAEPAVLGADLNTWCLGRWESAWKQIARVFPHTSDTSPRGASVHDTLDYTFLRLLPGWTSETRRLRGTHGSDHRPIVTVVRLGRDGGALNGRETP